MSETKQPVPSGYWQDANGALIPTAKIKEIDKEIAEAKGSTREIELKWKNEKEAMLGYRTAGK